MKPRLTTIATTTLAAALAVTGATLSQTDRPGHENWEPSPDFRQLAELRSSFHAALLSSLPSETDTENRRSAVAEFYRENADAIAMIEELRDKLAPQNYTRALARQRQHLELMAGTDTGGASAKSYELARKRLQL